MRIFHSDSFVVPLPEDHRFPMEKYALLRERVEAWIGEARGRLEVPPAAGDRALLTVHDREYLAKLETGSLTAMEVRRMGFPWSPALVERSRRSVGGTLAAARWALKEGVAVNLSGGTHHAFPDRGEGFCVFNDVAVAARVMAREKKASRILILDLDVHQGNGTARIFRDSPEIFTLSIHGANNYPFRKEPGDLDLELPDGAETEEFLEAVDTGLRRAFSRPAFDLTFYIAGADPFHGDRLGRLTVTKEGLMERDRRVLEGCRKRGLPVAVVMGGGYAFPIHDTVDIHFSTVQTAAGLFYS
jgi:acetoin utilization deacetylase AcuC-like enzyme